MATSKELRSASNEQPERSRHPSTQVGETPTLSISREKVCHIVFKVREFDVKDLPTFLDDGSNPADEDERPVLEDRPDDPVARELAAFISVMNFDEQVDLVTLTWLGRGDGTIAEWDELHAEAARAHNKHTARYLLGMPLLADYLIDALLEFGRSCDEFDV